MTAWLIAAAAVTGAVLVLGKPLKWALTLLLAVNAFLEEWHGRPAQHGIEHRPGVLERLQRVEKVTNEIKAETQPNGGYNLRDVVSRTAADVADVRDDVKRLRGRVELFEHQREDRSGEPDHEK